MNPRICCCLSSDGRESQDMVELVDLFPTLTSLVGFKELDPCSELSFKVQNDRFQSIVNGS